MVSSSAVSADQKKFESLLSKYNSQTSNLAGSWEGASATNFNNKTNEFYSEYKDAVSTQIGDFASAISLYQKYVQKKDEIDSTRSLYYQAKSEENNYLMRKYSNEISDLNDELKDLEEQIKDKLSSVVGTKFEAVNYTMENDFVNYYQYNYNQHYGCGTIATDGCGPTSLAMVLTYLLGREITPIETSEKGDGTYTCAKGTYWSYFEAMANEYGVNCEQKSATNQNIIDSLKDGKTIIAIMGPGHFTSGGHFIVLRGIDDDGKIIVADPNNEERSKQTWDVNIISDESSNLWVMDNDD